MGQNVWSGKKSLTFRTLGKDLVVYTGLEMSFLTMLLILLLRYKARYIDSLYRNYLKY